MEQATRADDWKVIRERIRKVIHRRHGSESVQGWLNLCTSGGKDGTSAEKWRPWLAELDEDDPEGTCEMRQILLDSGLRPMRGPEDFTQYTRDTDTPPGHVCYVPPQGAGDTVDLKGNTIHGRVTGVENGTTHINYYGDALAPYDWRPVEEVRQAEFDVRAAQLVPGRREMPPYVDRDRDADLADRLERGAFVLIVAKPLSGTSYIAWRAVTRMTGYRMCTLRPGTDLSTLPGLLKDQMEAGSRTGKYLLWLDDLDIHLRQGDLGPGLLARLSDLGVVVLATMDADAYRRQRTDRVVTRAHKVEVVRQWSRKELSLLERLAGKDPRLAAAYEHHEGEGVAAHLAFGHLLCDEWNDQGARTEHPRGHLLVRAAVDLFRCGVRQAVPESLLKRMHEEAYGAGADGLSGESFEDAFGWATRDCFQAPGLGLLVPDGLPGCWRVHSVLTADLDLDQEPVPERVWEWLVDEVTGVKEGDGVDRAALMERYCKVLRPRAEAGDFDAMAGLARLRRRMGDDQGAKHWYRRAAEAGSPEAAAQLGELLVELNDVGAEAIFYLEVAASSGNRDSAALLCDVLQERMGHWVQVAAAHGNSGAGFQLALQRLGAGRIAEGVKRLSEAAGEGDKDAAQTLAELRSALAEDRPGNETADEA
jgi:TPR repeat protein